MANTLSCGFPAGTVHICISNFLTKKLFLYRKGWDTSTTNFTKSSWGGLWQLTNNPAGQSALANALFLRPPVHPLQDTTWVQILFPLKPVYLQVLWQVYALWKMAKTPEHTNCAPKIFPMATSPVPWMLRAEGSSLQSGTSSSGWGRVPWAPAPSPPCPALLAVVQPAADAAQLGDGLRSHLLATAALQPRVAHAPLDLALSFPSKPPPAYFSLHLDGFFLVKKAVLWQEKLTTKKIRIFLSCTPLLIDLLSTFYQIFSMLQLI